MEFSPPVSATEQAGIQTNQGSSRVYSLLSTGHRERARRLHAPNIPSDLKWGGGVPLFGGGMCRTGEIAITGVGGADLW